MGERYRNELPAKCVRPITLSDPSDNVILDNNDMRKDERTINRFRPICVVKRASGSAYIELKNTKVLCSVYGPRPMGASQSFSSTGNLYCHFKYATFAKKDQRKLYTQDNEEKEYSTIVEESLSNNIFLDKYPKSRFDCFILVLEDDGSSLSAAITASSLAFADAGIEMYDLVASCSAAKVTKLISHNNDNDNKMEEEEEEFILLDPTWREEQYSIATVTIAYSLSTGVVSQLLQSGYISLPQITEAVDLCIDGSSKLYSIMKKCLSDGITENTNSVY